MTSTLATDAVFIGAEIYRTSSYGSAHPLAIPRVSTVIDLARALGWLDAANYRPSPVATPEQLVRFHDRAYVEALVACEQSGQANEEARSRFNLGCNGNPVFAEMFRRPATACGGSLLAARLLAKDRARLVFNPAGGTHHGRHDRASGFCFLNDPALAILALLDAGIERVAYVDIDAHHGDGVQDAFSDEDRVLTISIHEDGRWPMVAESGAGRADDRGGGNARNFPVPRDFNDSEMAYLMDRAILPMVHRFDPDVLVLQAGADALADDPQSRLALSNQAHWGAARTLIELAPSALVLGGGGYNPWSVARCWTGLWGLMTDRPIPGRLSEPAEAVLRSLAWRHRLGRNPPPHWFTTLDDAPRPGPVRPQIARLADQASTKLAIV